MPNGPLRFEDLLEAAPDAMVGVDAAGSVVFANAKARALLARDPVGTPLGETPGLEAIRSPMGELELVVLRPAEPTVARCAPCSTTARRRSSSRTPTGAT